jgi:hypothetical protein
MRSASAVVLCIVVAVSAPAFAQERAWFFSSRNPGNNTLFAEVSVDNGGRTWSALRRFALPEHKILSLPVLAAGGRLIVWAGARGTYEPPILRALDTRTGQQYTFSNIPIHGRAQFANDRRSGRLVVRDDAGLYLIDPQGRTPLMTIALPRLRRSSYFLATGRGRIFVGWDRDCCDRTVTARISVIDGATGVTIGELPDASAGVLSADERRFYALSYVVTGTTLTVRVSVYDTDTLELVLQGMVPAGAGFSLLSLIDGAFLTWTPGTVVDAPGTAYYFHPVFRAYSATSFAQLGELAPPLLYKSNLYGSELTFSTGFGGATLYVRSHELPVQDYFDTCGYHPRIDVFDTRTLAHLGTIDPSEFLAFDPSQTFVDVCYPPRYLSPPDPPTRLRTAIGAGTVHLEWDPPADIADYEILVGSRPAASDIGEFRTFGKAFADFRRAPRGTYYVRVRARNELGTAESAEIKVVVP